MENNELKKVPIKNHACYYFDDIIKLEDFHLCNILIDKKSHENILIYDTSYKTLIGSKLLRVRFNKIDEIIRIYDGTKYLILFGTKKYDAIYDSITFLTESLLFFSLICKSQNWFLWFFAYRKNIDFA